MWQLHDILCNPWRGRIVLEARADAKQIPKTAGIGAAFPALDYRICFCMPLQVEGGGVAAEKTKRTWGRGHAGKRERTAVCPLQSAETPTKKNTLKPISWLWEEKKLSWSSITSADRPEYHSTLVCLWEGSHILLRPQAGFQCNTRFSAVRSPIECVIIINRGFYVFSRNCFTILC